MNMKWTIISVLGLSAVATASPNVQFTTVIDQADSIGGDTFNDAIQVVAGPNGTVGISALNNSGPVIIYSTPSSPTTWNNTAVAVAGSSYNIPPIGSSEQFNYFDNLAMSGSVAGGTNLTFDAED